MTKKNRNEEDVEVIITGFKIYFQEKYQLISFANDVLSGLMFIAGSLVNLLNFPAIYGQVIYLIASIFLTIRPLLKALRRIWVSKV